MALVLRALRLSDRLAEVVVLTLVGLSLAPAYAFFAPAAVDPRGGLAVLVAGTAERPFVYRQLAPLLIRAGAQLFDVSLETAALGLLFASCVGWVWAMRFLAGAVFSRYEAFLAAVLIAGPLPLFVLAGGYVYDVPHLALFTLGLALLVRPWTSRAAMGMIAVTLTYLIAGTVLLPHYWLDPLGPWLKVVPAMALCLFVAGTEARR